MIPHDQMPDSHALWHGDEDLIELTRREENIEAKLEMYKTQVVEYEQQIEELEYELKMIQERKEGRCND